MPVCVTSLNTTCTVSDDSPKTSSRTKVCLYPCACLAVHILIHDVHALLCVCVCACVRARACVCLCVLLRLAAART